MAREMLAEFLGTFVLIVFGAGVIGVSLGFNSGYAISPARDFAPRLFTAMAGWGLDVFRAGNGWWWVPVVAPCVGAVAGGWLYDVSIGDRFHIQHGVNPAAR